MTEQPPIIEKNEHKQVIEMFGRIEKKFETELEEKHGIASDPPHPYHSLKHSKFVREQSLSVFDKIKNTTPWVLVEMDKSEYENLALTHGEELESKLKVQRAYVSMLAMGHDIVQNGFIKTDGTFARFRGIMPGQNEFESAVRIVGEITEVAKNNKVIGEYLNRMQLNSDRVFCDVNATFPEFDPKALLPETDNEALRITQPYLFDASMAGKIIALCDLYAPYSGNDATSEFWSDAEFWETHPHLIQIAQSIDHEKITDPRDSNISEFISEIKSWISRQEGFIKWLDHTFISNIRALREQDDGLYKEAADVIANSLPVERHLSLARLAAARKIIIDRFISGTRQQGMTQFQERLKILLVALNFYDLELNTAVIVGD